MIILEYENKQYFIRSYDPNPERYHPDNNQLPQQIQPLPQVAVNGVDAALAEEIAF